MMFGGRRDWVDEWKLQTTANPVHSEPADAIRAAQSKSAGSSHPPITVSPVANAANARFRRSDSPPGDTAAGYSRPGKMKRTAHITFKRYALGSS
jgi:hypothetical protein